MMHNPCSKCGTEPQLNVDSSSVAFLLCQNCNNADYYALWNINNPIHEPDPLAIAHEQLAECYELLDQILISSCGCWDSLAIRESAKALLVKYREANNA